MEKLQVSKVTEDSGLKRLDIPPKFYNNWSLIQPLENEKNYSKIYTNMNTKKTNDMNVKNIFHNRQSGVQGNSPDRIALGKVAKTVTMQSCIKDAKFLKLSTI